MMNEVLLKFKQLDLSPYIQPLPEKPAEKLKVYGIDGAYVADIEAPLHFLEPIRPDLIRRAYLSALSARFQPKGVYEGAGKEHSCESFGVGLGIARIPRYKGSLWPRGCFAPNTRGGRRAHPPKVEKKLHEEINKKEKKLAIRSAIAATAYRSWVAARGHVVEKVPSLPVVVVGDAEKINRAKEAKKLFEALGLWPDVERAAEGVKIRAGKGKMRGRRYKEPKSVLVVVSDLNAPLIAAVRNFPGVDVVAVNNLNILVLAPGGVPGRLTLWTAPAVEKLRGLFL
ncbi:ribosomal protein L4 [Pyrobaculum aerophilum str. IM2]|uniref:Large ribosomal subunit protein uL4 n=2 Tax=Pyrobaculum aerophilum TaxID=13773 RepID=RL4_PYRAE|nr:RecName: Full=Large ribosomal subunit protein uL4; AltName: Full=50S ribosomal protein L4 [Pyrobaculum aerophilum str. IM2]AAL63851.1 ribosomal protein L4 [Pyrobaculum aerophilum str. IM2]